MNPETINAIKEALAPIAAKIGQGAEYGWEIVMRQQYIQGVTLFIWAGSLIIATFVCIYASNKCWANKKRDGQYSDWEIGGVMGAIGAIIFAICAVICLVAGIQHILNPAYYSLDFFIHLGSKAN